MKKPALPKQYKTDDLRAKAEQCLAQEPNPGQCNDETGACKLMHELQVYALELEMQNESLITAQSQVRAALDRYTELFDFAPVGYLTLDIDGKVIEINLTGASMLGIERGRLIGRPLNTYIVNPELFKNYLEQVFNHADNVIIELKIMRPDGVPLDVQMESRVSDDDPLPIRMIMTDISSRKTLEQQLQHQRYAMDSLIKQQVAIHTASAIAHDLNQPLAAISAFSEAALTYLTKNVVTSQPLQRALKGCVEQSQRAGLCLHELLDFLQKRDFVTDHINLNQLIQDVISIIRHDQYSDFRPELKLEPNLPAVKANALQIRKVLQNLLCNSLHAVQSIGFNPDDIVIKVSTRADWNMAQITVQDSGPGLNDETARRIFEPFFTTKPNGSGLGLAISRSLIEANGGQLWMEPHADKGAIFHFTLPFDLPV